MKRTALKLAFVIALLMLSVTAFVYPAYANPLPPPPPIAHAYIRSDGNVEPPTLPIKRDGYIYFFTNEIFNYTLEIQCDNIVLDGAGFVLKGHGSGYYSGITLSNRHNVTIKNLSIDQFGCCVSLLQSSNIVIKENKMSGTHGITLNSDASGKVSNPSDNNQIIRNNIVGCGSGVSGLGSFNSIVGNNFTGSGFSIKIGGNNNTISENLFIDDKTNIMLTGENGSQNNTLSKNIIVGGEGDGIYFAPHSAFNIVFGNNVTKKLGCGVKIHCSYNNTFYENYLANNGFGIYIDNPAFTHHKFPGSKYNIFYHNTLTDNVENARIEKTFQGGMYPNLWDNGSEGNSWSNYNGTDADGDGVGDTPLVIDAVNIDHYPLCQKAPFPATLVAVASGIPIAAVAISLLIYFKKRNR